MSNCSNVTLFAAIFAALYLGTDYSNGTIRNKMIIGHTRAEIYFANLVTVAVGGVLIFAAACAAMLVLGLCLGGKLGMPAGEFALDIAVCLCAVIAICAIFTVLGMLFSSKSTIITLTLVLTFVLVISAAMIASLLAEPEYTTEYMITADGGVEMSEELKPNPLYVSGIKRDILTAVNDVLPSGQLMQMEIGIVQNAGIMPLYSLGVLAVSTAVGAVVFRRKELK
ncbi:MAG: ABC transporter permease [Oscillospiraceae bacterium]|nr:ABC transporter permease [Oscillospiraceae bacterium]